MGIGERPIEQHELIEFFGVLPEVDEEECTEFYCVEKDGIRLGATFFYTEGVHISVVTDRKSSTVFSLQHDGEFKVSRISGNKGFDCLEFTVPHLESFNEPDWGHSFNLRMFVEPHIKIEILS